jgi:sugar lactone lactonase YvrE
MTYSGVYRVSADRGTITLLANDFVFPNGLAFSPYESVLYIGDYLRGHIRAFDVASNGTLAKQTDRIFADLRGPEPGGPDGMKVDTAGNVNCAQAMFLAAVQVRYTSLIRRVKSSAAPFTGIQRRPISLSVARTGKHHTSPLGTPLAQ